MIPPHWRHRPPRALLLLLVLGSVLASYEDASALLAFKAGLHNPQVPCCWCQAPTLTAEQSESLTTNR